MRESAQGQRGRARLAGFVAIGAMGLLFSMAAAAATQFPTVAKKGDIAPGTGGARFDPFGQGLARGASLTVLTSSRQDFGLW